MTKKVLVTWVAVGNDPYEFDKQSQRYREVNGAKLVGPTLSLMEGEYSHLRTQIHDVVLLYRDIHSSEREKHAVRDLRAELKKRDIKVHPKAWGGVDPTDHKAIFEFLRKAIPEIRNDFPEAELVVHVSPGTPAMHTVWVLMAETGFIDLPFQIVQSKRESERRGGSTVVPASVGIETFYKTFKSSRPKQGSADDQSVVWDPTAFRSARMRELYAEARRFAKVNVPILIRGERGTGKTTLAGWIRANSPYRQEKLDKGWPSVACGQYSPETMRSELFGHTKGAFTGASEAKKGLLEIANKDTLFLDEIGDISRDLQRLLIRAIEEKTFFALGDETPRKSDFRLISATNIEEGMLRERLDPDFYDRVSSLTLTLPALREVPEELDWLWPTVFTQAKKRSGVRVSVKLPRDLETQLIRRLQSHTLPGNIRDLFRVAYRICAILQDSEEASVDVVEYALMALRSETGGATLAKEIALAFANSQPLDSVLDRVGNVPTKEVFGDLQVYLARELKRLQKERGLEFKALTDVTGRTLNNWNTGEE